MNDARQTRFSASAVPRNPPGADPFLVLLASLWIVICETPYLTRNLHPAILGALMGLFVVKSVLGPKATNLFAVDSLIPVSLYVLLELFYKVLGISSAGLGYYFATYKFLFLFLAMSCIGPVLSRSQQTGLCVLSVAGLLVNMLDNIRIWLQVGPAAYVVYFMRDGETTNTADTAFATAVMLLMGAMFLVSRHADGTRLKALAWGIVAFCAYVLAFVMQRGTTFFLGFAMLLALGFSSGLSSVRNSLKIVFGLLLLALLGWLLWGGGLESFLAWLATLLEGQRLQSRVLHMLGLLQSGSMESTGGSLAFRYNLMLASLETFTGSPGAFVLGVGDHRLPFNGADLPVGNHSQLIDTFARYGIVGGACFVWLLAHLRKGMCRNSRLPPGSPLRTQMAVLFVFFLLRTLLGTTLIGSVATQLFVTIPLTVSLLARGTGVRPEPGFRPSIQQ
ncbi:MAG: hypothetical protein IJS32_09215 [Kiritimatiellae bacterium]|nr:hypothetical protein [Kiritimatiellia bacterium]